MKEMYSRVIWVEEAGLNNNGKGHRSKDHANEKRKNVDKTSYYFF